MNNKVLEINNLTFAFGDNVILEDVNLSIENNKFLAVIGPNGAGKSTFFNLLLGNYTNYRGEIKLFGDNCKDENHYSDIAYIPQNAILTYKDFPTTVEEVVKIHLKQLKTKESVEYYLELVGLIKHRKKMLRELSGGQLQRLALALALSKKARLIILDEPTSGIDKEFSDEFFNILKSLSKQDKTILIATHNLAAIRPYVDEVACIENRDCKILSEKQIESELKYRHVHRNNRLI